VLLCQHSSKVAGVVSQTGVPPAPATLLLC
jgi:hypothetical protein